MAQIHQTELSGNPGGKGTYPVCKEARGKVGGWVRKLFQESTWEVTDFDSGRRDEKHVDPEHI